jgi:hypothetical protein
MYSVKESPLANLVVWWPDIFSKSGSVGQSSRLVPDISCKSGRFVQSICLAARYIT